jgi:protocatechuate 3,4-dioxygenase beta subunit
MRNQGQREWNRREAMWSLGLLWVWPLGACGGQGARPGGLIKEVDDSAVETGENTGTGGSGMGSDGGSEEGGMEGSEGEGWASGGTAAMSAKATYPNPFEALPESCMVVTSTTQGPCTTESDLEREDISEEWVGLPVRLLLRVVDIACAPLVGAAVKIWHTNREGSYSGETPRPEMCLMKEEYGRSNFFRGVQNTDEQGVARFDSCFPGWYPGRAVHIHFQVSVGGRVSEVSQVFFPEAVTEEIFRSHPEYQEFGQPNTDFADDNIMSAIPESQRSLHILNVTRMSDGAMLASQTVAV